MIGGGIVVHMRSKDLILAVDLGGSGLRAGIVDASGKVRLVLKKELKLVREGDGGLAVSFSANIEEEITSFLLDATENLMEDERGRVRAVVTTSMREGFVLLGDADEVLYAGPNADYRGLGEAMRVNEEIGDEIYRRTGQWIRPPAGAIHAPCRLPVLLSSKAGGIGGIRRFMMLADWMNYLLCGKAVSERSNASSSAMFDLRTGDWCYDIASRCGLESGMLPEATAPGSFLGFLSEGKAGRKLRLDPSTMVIEGGADTQCSLIGCGAINIADVALVSGTTTPIQMVVHEPVVDRLAHTWTSHHAVDGKWVLESNAGRTGYAYRWFACLVAEVAGISEDRAYAYMDMVSSDSAPGASGVSIALDSQVMGQPGAGPGVKGLISGISTTGCSKTGFAELCRAMMENLAAAYAENIAQLERVSGRKVESAFVCGGSTRSSGLMQIISDCIGVRLKAASEAETTMLGAAILAAVGSGLYKDLNEAVAVMVGKAKEYEPDFSTCAAYVEVRKDWVRTKQAAIDFSSRKCDDGKSC